MRNFAQGNQWRQQSNKETHEIESMADSGTEQTAVATPEKITMKKKDKSRRSKTDKGNLAVEISKQREFEEQVKTQDSQVGIVAETSLLYRTHY